MTRSLRPRTLLLMGLLALLSLVALSGCDQAVSLAAGPGPAPRTAKPGVVTVEIAYLNHPPVRPVMADVDTTLAKYGDKVQVTKYDFDTPEGQAFAKARGLTEHTPLAIYIDGTMEFNLGGRQVKFYSFPQGSSTPMSPPGAWTLADLDAALAQTTGAKP